MKRKMIQIALVAAFATVGCKGPGYNLPPLERLMEPGPGVGGPGPGVLTAADRPVMSTPDPNCEVAGDSTIAVGPVVQVMFARPEGMQVSWDTTGNGDFGTTPLIVPGRTNFPQAGLYRVKLQNIVGHEGLELYPTLEVGPPNPRTLAFLAHNAIPLQLSVDDFNQVTAGNFVTKVIYLPDPEFQELAVAGVETLVSTRLDPGVNPIAEADRRGSIMAVLRVGNKDIEMPGMSGQSSEYFGALGSAGGYAGGYAGTGAAPGYAAGAGGPIYGMPSSGTPIGLVGPPHIPLGGPAGLRKHVIRNHTHTYVPDPSHDVKIHVKQRPRVSYPAPRTRAWIGEYNHPNCSHCGGNGCSQCAGP